MADSICFTFKGAPLQPRLLLAVVQAKYCSSFQLTYMSRDNHAQCMQSIKSAMAANGKARNCYSTHNCASTVSFGISERQRSQLCGQNLCGPFVRVVLATTS